MNIRRRWSASWARAASLAEWLPRLVARAPATIQVKLLSAFLVIVALLIAVGAAGLQALSDANRQDGELVALDRKLAAYRQLQNDTTTQLYSVSSALLSPDPPTLDKALRELNLFSYDLERLQFVAADEADLLKHVGMDHKQFTAVMTQVIELTRAGQVAQAHTLQLQQAGPLADSLERLTNELVNRAEADIATRIDQNRRAYDASQRIIIGFALGSIVLALILGYAISWSLIAPVRQINARLGEIAAGDFAQHVKVPNRDELGPLTANLNRMNDELGRLYAELEARNRDLVESQAQRQILIEQNARQAERARIEQEMRTAQHIQQSLLPRQVPALPGWQFTPYYKPAKEVGGDFYDFMGMDDGRLGIFIGDVAGKGVPAALVMAITRTMLRTAARAGDSPGQVLAQVNDLLSADIPPGMFVTCFYALLNPASGHVHFANAGHELPYRRHAEHLSEMRATGMPLGIMPSMNYEEFDVTLIAGDCVLFHSDGLVEAHNAKREMFGLLRLETLLQQHPDGATLIDFLLGELNRFTGGALEQEDDLTLVTIQRIPQPDILNL